MALSLQRISQLTLISINHDRSRAFLLYPCPGVILYTSAKGVKMGSILMRMHCTGVGDWRMEKSEALYETQHNECKSNFSLGLSQGSSYTE